MTKNRESVRKAIAELFAANLVGAGLPVAEVAACQKSKITVTPLIEVLSAGSSRAQKGLGTKNLGNIFYFEVHTLIRDSDETGLNELEREDRLDLIDEMISETVTNNQSGDAWDRLTFAGGNGGRGERSKASKVNWDGKAYLFEVHQLEVIAND
jgi:hypothetical protein